MNFIEFLFKLISHFVTFENNRKAELQEQADKWIARNKDNTGLLGKLIKYQNEWYVQLILCFVLLFSVKAISRWMVSEGSTGDDQEIDDDDLDDEDAYEAFKSERKERRGKMALKF